MDDEDRYPNFGTAYPSTASSVDPAAVAASWHPALRPQTETNDAAKTSVDSEEDDFFERYPGATPKKAGTVTEVSAGSPLRPSEDEVPDADPESQLRRRSISVQYMVDVRKEDATPEMLQRVPSNAIEIQGPVSRRESIDEEAVEMDEEGAILSPEDSAQEQEMALQSRMPDSTEDLETPPVREANPFGVDDDEELLRPEEHYEHQGEATEMEEALEPSASAPLMDESEDLPTPGFASREPSMSIPSRGNTLDVDGAPAPRQPRSKAQVSPPQLDRSFTTNFSDSPIEARSAAQPHNSVPDDWPSVGDDATFGELLDERNKAPHRLSVAEKAGLEQVAAQEAEQIASPDTQHAELEQIASHESAHLVSPDDELLPESEGEIKEDDLAAAWGAAVDDDDVLLEETPTDLDPSQFFGADDDGGFLEDELLPEKPAPAVHQQQKKSSQQYRPANSPQPIRTQQPQYGAPGPTFIDQSNSHGRSAGTPTTGLFDVYNTQGALQQTPQQQPPHRPGLQQATSFADKTKGGYQSPYDLPMEVVKPRRRQPGPQSQQSIPNVQTNQRVPPPRTSSMSSSTTPTPTSVRPPAIGMQTAPAAPPRRPGTAGSGASMSPPQSSGSGGPGGVLVKSTPKTGSGFFEELPVTTKARPRGTPQIPQHAMPPTPPVGGPPLQQQQQQQQQQLQPRSAPGFSQPHQPLLSQPALSSMGVRRPDQLPLFPDQNQAMQASVPQPTGPSQGTRYSPSSQQAMGTTLPAPPATQNRYSPAPISSAQPLAATSRYSPAPGSAPKQAPPAPRHPSNPMNALPGAHAFAPRTSSPLAAMTDKPYPPLPPEARGIPTSSPPRTNGIQQQQRNVSMSPPEQAPTSRYAPSEAAVHPPTTFTPPQRPRTQSPDTTMKGPRAAAMAMQSAVRPSSAAGSPATATYQQQPQPSTQRAALPHRRQFSQTLTFAPPQDSRSLDPLERWKGNPIFKWTAGGSVITTFPKQTPFYAAGQGVPSVKCTPGPITVQDMAALMPMEAQNTRFPGPLTARSKKQKKDVLAWLGTKIEVLERDAERAMLDFSLEVSLRKRVEEKVVLWKLVRSFVEFDGVLEGNPKIEEEVRRILMPNLAQMAQVADLQSPVSASLMPDPVDKQILFQIRQALLEGQRERAVWLAEEKKLWGHAMLIASTMGPETWKLIVQAFVRSQVKNVGSDARSTAALYQVFAGNAEECVDELVPPSARAGFQMISKADGSVSGNPLEGLDQWRETLGLITSNRTANDGLSLIALGKLLAGYGRVEAAHSCFLFARQFVKLSGPDDADVNFVLLGANHQVADENFGNDLDSILLTEVYEYAASLSAPSTAVLYIPHLQAFKLIHAHELAAYGNKSKAQKYCNQITTAYTSTTKASPYYHPTFTQAVADFGFFLSEAPHDEKGSWTSKPSLTKVKSGASSWFNKFVAGDDDQESTGSGPGVGSGDEMAGPFGRVNGESPSLSRQGSVTDLYNPLMGGGVPIPGMAPATAPAFAPSSAPSRYAPGLQAGGSKYSPGQPYSGLGIPAIEPQRPASSSRYAPAPSSSLGVPRPDVQRRASDHSLPYAPSSRRGSAQETTSSQGSYEPRPVLSDDASGYSYSPAFNSPLVQAHDARAMQEPDDVFPGPNGLPEPLDVADDRIEDAEGGGGGYLPPTSGYEPPSYSYQPYEPEPDSREKPLQSKKATLASDDDNDDAETSTRTAALTKKAQADREADELFRKAAEADAARDKSGTAGEQKKGWLTGWFGGKKDPNAAPGPIRAKLGEESSFYFDKDLGKWVNKKGGAEAAAPVAATPPPPKGPPSRIASAGGVGIGPPSGPPSRASSGVGLAFAASAAGGAMRPPTSGSGPAFSGPSSGPPSRVGTPTSEGSQPGGVTSQPAVNGEGVAVAAQQLPPLAPPIRPSSSLSTASSIDDLLGGPPGSRKGGTVKGRKKGNRYVDVMKQ